MWGCCKKSDPTVEFLDLCMDGMIDEVKDLYNTYIDNEEQKN